MRSDLCFALTLDENSNHHRFHPIHSVFFIIWFVLVLFPRWNNTVNALQSGVDDGSSLLPVKEVTGQGCSALLVTKRNTKKKVHGEA